MKRCRKCLATFEPKPYQLIKRDYLCPSCKRAEYRSFKEQGRIRGMIHCCIYCKSEFRSHRKSPKFCNRLCFFKHQTKYPTLRADGTHKTIHRGSRHWNFNNKHTKVCSACKVEKSKTQFHGPYRVNSFNGRCKTCQSMAGKVWRQTNKELALKIKRKYRREKPEVHQLSEAKRRALKKRALADFTLDEWNNIKKAYSYKCVYCGRKRPLTQDHVVSLVTGGEHTAKNIVPSCQSCNAKKGGYKKLPFQPVLEGVYCG